MNRYDYVIIGAGLFGATFANILHKSGKKCLVIEKRDHLGGLANTFCMNNIDVHRYGAHIFHTKSRDIWNYVNSFVEFSNYKHAPIAIYKDKVYNLPFNMNTFVKMWNIKTPEEAKLIIDSQKEKYGVEEPTNLEELAINMVGKDIYEILIKGYTEKQWGKEAKLLPAFIISRLPVRFTFDNNYFNDNYQGIPFEGYTRMIEKMLEGIEVRLNTDYFDNPEHYQKLGDKLVYTGVIDKFFDYCYGQLEYRSIRFELEVKETPNYQGISVVNYTDIEIPFTRIIEHKHFNQKPNQIGTIITREYPQKWTVEKEPYYPINDQKNQDLYSLYEELSKKQVNTIFGGRLAEYKYYDMDKVIESAIKKAEIELQND